MKHIFIFVLWPRGDRTGLDGACSRGLDRVAVRIEFHVLPQLKINYYECSERSVNVKKDQTADVNIPPTIQTRSQNVLRFIAMLVLRLRALS